MAPAVPRPSSSSSSAARMRRRPVVPAVVVSAALAGLVALPAQGAGAASSARPAASSASSASASPVSDPASLVDPFIGTTNSADDFPGADVPFGMVQWSPDTSPNRPDGGGYEYSDSAIA